MDKADCEIIVWLIGNSSWIPPPNLSLHFAPRKQKTPFSMHREWQPVQMIQTQQPDENVWLFHIPSDPYEEINLAQKYPDIVKNLLQRLSYYNSTAVPPYYPKSDPNCDPKLHNGFWSPWM